jgi:hypothetical protein
MNKVCPSIPFMHSHHARPEEGFVPSPGSYNPKTKMYECKPCQASVPKLAEMRQHLHGKKHQVEMNKEVFHCNCCQVTTKTKDEKREHLSGKKHLRNLRSSCSRA